MCDDKNSTQTFAKQAQVLDNSGMKYVFHTNLSIDECRQRLKQNTVSGHWRLFIENYGKVWGKINSGSFELHYSYYDNSYDGDITLRGKMMSDKIGTTITCNDSLISFKFIIFITTLIAISFAFIGVVTGNFRDLLILLIPVLLIFGVFILVAWILNKIAHHTVRYNYLLDFLKRTIEAEQMSSK